MPLNFFALLPIFSTFFPDIILFKIKPPLFHFKTDARTKFLLFCSALTCTEEILDIAYGCKCYRPDLTMTMIWLKKASLWVFITPLLKTTTFLRHYFSPKTTLF